MPTLLLLLACASPPHPSLGYLYEPATILDYELRLPARPYSPQAGDIFLATDEGLVARTGHLLAKSGAPHHSGIIFALPDGRPALLEAGPDNGMHVRVLDLGSHLNFYCTRKRVWIRQRAVPLTAEQSRRLTAFALAAADRPFAWARLTFQVNPLLRSKGPVRTALFGRPFAAHFDPDNPEPSMRRKYFCSELVTEACVAAGLLPADTARPTSVYPRELFFGTSRVPYLRDHMDLSAWAAPSRWTAEPGTEAKLKPRPFLDGDTGGGRREP